MALLVCKNCKRVYEVSGGDDCPGCRFAFPHSYNYAASDAYLKREIPRVLAQRAAAGLEGLVGGLECIIINTEKTHLRAAAQELLDNTGLELGGAFRDDAFAAILLKAPGSADVLVTSRLRGRNPFATVNRHPRSKDLPNTRLETFVYRVSDIDRYVAIQRERGVRFMSARPIQGKSHAFIQTAPSRYTGNSTGFVEWRGERRDWRGPKSERFDAGVAKPRKAHLAFVKEIDHAATRVRAEDRDLAIIEFMELTSYRFDFAIYVKVFNSITNVARLTAADYAMVFTSGIAPYVDDDVSGPTEKFIHGYGARVHHVAFRTERIERVFSALKREGMEFLIDLVGSKDEGLKQTFTMPSPLTMLVTEYIHRYGDFDGFFTKSNVTLLTGATARQ
ncbi:MAG TPA: hypothetical protein VMT60_04100 [Candidatus Bathyarchaeia archaeon]|nr:hypothetical protein [Candidatus Bathyarchaeia archaeon]